MTTPEDTPPPQILDNNKRLERSLDSLQRIYAVVAALAIGEAVKRACLDGDQLVLRPRALVLLIGFLATIVPFVHGMNRHLDDHLHRVARDRHLRVLQELVVDVFVFLLESLLFFVWAVLLVAPEAYYVAAGFIALLAVDIVWSTWHLQSHGDHDDGEMHRHWRWTNIRFITALVALSGVEYQAVADRSTAAASWIDAACVGAVSAIACWRSYLDYTKHLTSVYFPALHLYRVTSSDDDSPSAEQ